MSVSAGSRCGVEPDEKIGAFSTTGRAMPRALRVSTGTGCRRSRGCEIWRALASPLQPRRGLEPEHAGGVGRHHLVDLVVLVTELQAERDAAAKTFERTEHADLAEIRAQDGVVDAGRVDLMAQVLSCAGLELRSVQEHAERMLDHGAHRGDAPDVVEAGADDVLRMGEDQTLDAAPLRLLEDEPGLADVQVAARQDHVVLGDHVEHVLDAVQHLLVGVEHRHW